MTLSLRHSGATKGIAKLHLRHGGATKEIVRLWLRKGGASKLVYQSISGAGSAGISVSPTSVSGAGSSTSSIAITTRVATVTLAGGVAPITYAWSQVSGDPMTATNPSGVSSAFSASVDPGTRLAAVFKCTVTDAAGITGSVNVNAALFNRGGTL